MSKVWCQAVYPLKAPNWGWAVWPEGEPAALVRGKASSEQDARQRSSEAIAEASKPWMVEVAREANAVGYDDAKMDGAAADVRSGLRDADGETATAVRALRLALERGHVVEGGPIREMLLAGQGDDDGSQILPDLHEGMTLHEMVAACVHLLERRRDALDGYADSGCAPLPVPSKEEMLKAAREDAAQAMEQMGHRDNARFARLGQADQGWHVQAALQARRNMLREMGARPSNWMPPVKEGLVAGSMPREMGRLDPAKMKPLFYREGSTQAFDLEAALKRAWDAGALWSLLQQNKLIHEDRAIGGQRDVSSILSTLPAKE